MSSGARVVIKQLQAVGVMLALACIASGLYQLQVLDRPAYAWWLLASGLVLAVAGQAGLRFPAPAVGPRLASGPAWRRVVGALLALAGMALWGFASYRLSLDWREAFDFAWAGWLTAAIILGLGLDMAWGRWRGPTGKCWTTGTTILVIALLAIAAAYRLGNIADFPGEAAITQIEDLQVGNFGAAYLHGYRWRWEYLSSTWLAALGIWVGGPTQLAMRIPFAVVSFLKILPLFLWLRLTVGGVGAAVGTTLLVFSNWDVVLSRIPNNHNTLIVAIVFALLAGPVRRGRPSGYVWLGFLGGFVLFEYVAYRPLAAFALLGATVWSLGDRGAGWLARGARPLLTAGLIAAMVWPLFTARIPGPLSREYFDGWNRARQIRGYYNPDDTWRQSIERRLERSKWAAGLFVHQGDRSPVRNIAGQPPLIDPVSATLLVLGIGCAAGNLIRPLFGVALLAFCVTIGGTLIATGNWDVARAGGAVPYVYALAGYGAAGVFAALSSAWGRVGRSAAALLLALALLMAGYWNTDFLLKFWRSPAVLHAHRNNLAYLTGWLRDHVGEGEQVLGIAPGYDNVLAGHDGSWLRGGEVRGTVACDVETALRAWEGKPGETVLFVFAGRGNSAVTMFLESLFPGLSFTLDPDPMKLNADVAYARLSGPPPELAARLATWHCRGVRGEYELIGSEPDEVVARFTTVAPLIDYSFWPAAARNAMYTRHPHPSQIRVRLSTPFVLREGGDYVFELGTYAGSGELWIDGESQNPRGSAPIHLSPGVHTLEIKGVFAPQAIEPTIRLVWSGPETGGQREVMPFYRIAPVDPSCAEASGNAPVVVPEIHGSQLR